MRDTPDEARVTVLEAGGGCKAHSTRIPSLNTAFAVLHLLPKAPPELVTAAHRNLFRQAHPDCGGSREGVIAPNRAVEIIHDHQRPLRAS
jgi:hypothetical protein